MAPSRGGIVVFSGGSAANSLVDVFESVRRSRSCSLAYIIPISDNGGSSSELIRVFGGPGIGDVRSRLVRLIPQQPYSKEREAIGSLLSYRLSGADSREAKIDWSEIVDGTSQLWCSIPSAKKELIRSFFNLVNLEILKRSRPPTSTFDFRSASIGNLFLTGARLFSGSFESAIYLLSSVCGIPDEDIKVIPSINSNFSHHIAAELEDGTVIVGQNSISHPTSLDGKTRHGSTKATDQAHMVLPGNKGIALMDGVSSSNISNGDTDDVSLVQEEEDAHPPFTLPTLRTNNIAFSKSADDLDDLPSRISRVHYVNSFGQEILPPANPRAVQSLQQASSVIYSIGSLYTSIVPNLVLRGIGETMHKNHTATKVLILNGCLDREVGPETLERAFTATSFIDAIVKAGEQSRGIVWSPNARSKDSIVDGRYETDITDQSTRRPSLRRAQSEGHTLRLNSYSKQLPPPMLASATPSRTPSPSTSTSPEAATPNMGSTAASSRSSSKPNPIYKHYVTHLIHLPNSGGTPFVDQELLSAHYGIKCIRVYGRRNETGPGMLYDSKALQGAIEAVLGGRGQTSSSADEKETAPRPRQLERGRRNTVER
ncbi:hypothetical protein PMZ80_001816 [Knufia obscura]|uniref:Uncharacterized protein n=2 Tax=Knufia TaxID=430999 RepID=A0AAN8E7X4_9EURO|nr:hypothetical protein PMZ80_001816 [Knufia obscura]KAK5948329.1 hypothetical protein OHC33_010639 [Knufia fluminis]